ncbi:flagellar motor protein MotP [Cerasibacillus terrae]|uniref:Flagellar motor protein MotP n=1 Tax=Cerasibacillus terrae TaxID=2498845 RepID=A0A5C8NF82_9BACI|nr:flagellar motor protein MotP [Cerasibacillus terrae]TXL60554.1 flagellar motor protein MotP [Cerasibacillus terrae]
MRKRDFLTPIGITLGFIMLIVAISTRGGENAATFFDFSSILIVFGGMLASLLISFNKEQIKMTGKVMQEAFHQNDQRLPNLIALFVHLSERARREGILALENELENVDDPFIKKGIHLAVDGIEPEMINDIMNAEITAMEERQYRGRQIIEKCAEYAPSWGMIGTLVGLVLMLTTLEDPESLGPSMAVALLTTLYGTILANLVFIPMANKLETKTEEDIFLKQIIIEGVIGVQSGQNPRILEEKLSAFLTESDIKQIKAMGEETPIVEESIHEA